MIDFELFFSSLASTTLVQGNCKLVWLSLDVSFNLFEFNALYCSKCSV